MRRGILAAAFATALLALPAPAAAARIGEITLRLFYERTGRLSAPVREGPDFNTWNMAWGGGSAEEPANDVLVSVEIVGEANSGPVGAPLEIVARNAQGRVIGRRVFRDLQFWESAHLWKSLWLTDATCDGLDITVTLGRASRRLQTEGFYCAE
jgi:hypothetical protein